MAEPIEVFSQSAICLRGSLTIYIDPFRIPKPFHDADFVFITHPHWDHFSLVDILKVKTENTNFIIPKDLYEDLLDFGILEEHIKVVKPFETYHFEKFSFTTIPAYNVKKDFHPKEKGWMGYLISFDQVIYYISGDTDVTKESKNVKADVIFLPVGGVYTMNYQEASQLANEIKPHLAIPTHYLSVVGSLDDAKNFIRFLHPKIASKIFYTTKGE